MTSHNVRTSARVAGVLHLLAALAAMAGALVGWTSSGLASHFSGAFLLLAAFSLFWIVVAVGLLRVRKWARLLSVSSCFLLLAVGVIFASVAGNVIPDLIENAKLAMPVMTAAVFLIAVFAVILPGWIAYSLTREEQMAVFESFDLSKTWADRVPLSVTVAPVAVGFLAASFAVCAVSGFPFAGPGFVLDGIASRLSWLAGGLIALWSLRQLFRLDPAGWWLAIILFVFLIVSWTLALLTGAVDWWGSFGREERLLFAKMGQSLERGMLGLEFFTNLAAIGYLLYIRGGYLRSK